MFGLKDGIARGVDAAVGLGRLYRDNRLAAAAVKEIPEKSEDDAITTIKSIKVDKDGQLEGIKSEELLIDHLTVIQRSLAKKSDYTRLNKSADILNDRQAIKNLFDIATNARNPELKETAANLANQLLDLSAKANSKFLSLFTKEAIPYVKDAVTAVDPRTRLNAVAKFLDAVQRHGMSLDESLRATLGAFDHSFAGEVGTAFRESFQDRFTEFLTHPHSILAEPISSPTTAAVDTRGLAEKRIMREELQDEFAAIQEVLGKMFINAVPKLQRNGELVRSAQKIITGIENYESRDGEGRSPALKNAIAEFNGYLTKESSGFLKLELDANSLRDLLREVSGSIHGAKQDKTVFISKDQAALIHDLSSFSLVEIKSGDEILGYHVEGSKELQKAIDKSLTIIEAQSNKCKVQVMDQACAIREAFKKLSIRDDSGKLTPGIEELFRRRTGMDKAIEMIFGGTDSHDAVNERIKTIILDPSSDTGHPDVVKLTADVIRKHLDSSKERVAITEARIAVYNKQIKEWEDRVKTPISTLFNATTVIAPIEVNKLLENLNSTENRINVAAVEAQSKVKELATLRLQTISAIDQTASGGTTINSRVMRGVNIVNGYLQAADRSKYLSEVGAVNQAVANHLRNSFGNLDSQVDIIQERLAKAISSHAGTQEKLGLRINADVTSALDAAGAKDLLTASCLVLDGYINDYSNTRNTRDGLMSKLEKDRELANKWNKPEDKASLVDEYLQSEQGKDTIEKHTGAFAGFYGEVHTGMTYNKSHLETTTKQLEDYRVSLQSYGNSDLGDLLISAIMKIINHIKSFVAAQN